ncbi:MAG: hypothetical protein LBD16_04045 [Oscillospiraceae bacterium]|jgi:chaperonin cofactor prefoldin|nr:hypothetical protein [Oscillospiraceae bacterium]
MTIGIEILIAVLGAGLTVATYFGGRQASAKSKGAADAEQRASLHSLKDWVELNRKKVDSINDEFTKIKIDLARIDSKVVDSIGDLFAKVKLDIAMNVSRIAQSEKQIQTFDDHVKSYERRLTELQLKLNALEGAVASTNQA